MSKIIDTQGKILTGDNHPQLKIGDKLYVVDDRKSTFDKINKVQGDPNVENFEDEIIRLALGKDKADEILNDPDLTVQGYKNLTIYIMSAISGEDFETIEQGLRERKN